ncbi:MAG TPA: HigA family addiction module antitoxin [Candidatus Binatia bacterium]|nr:HigA family addiction module antitoxin [Candidatus Binatia bacterium]
MREIMIPKHRRPSTPGEIIREDILPELKLTQQQFATALGIGRVRLNEILHDKRSVTADTAMRLERVLGVSAVTWLRLQLAVDIYDAQHSPQAKNIAKLKRIRSAA